MQGPSPAPPVIVACAFKDRSAAEPALHALIGSGIAAGEISVGGQPKAAADVLALAAEFGVRADIDPEDPLAGAPGLASAAQGTIGIDRGGVYGGAIGVVVGLALGFIPGVHIVNVDPSFRPLADALLFFIVGALAGATLGGALSPMRSTHAAFRIVDEIEHGGIAVVAVLEPDAADAALAALQSAGGLHAIRVPSAE